MLPELKAKWVEALRSGKYKQGILCLRSFDDKFCCLGVLCDIEKVPCFRSGDRYLYDYIVYKMGGCLPTVKLDEIGLSHAEMDVLVDMNDHGRTFAEIATYIEENL